MPSTHLPSSAILIYVLTRQSVTWVGQAGLRVVFFFLIILMTFVDVGRFHFTQGKEK